MTSLHTKLKELRELRGRATNKADFVEQFGFKDSNPESEEVYFLISHVCDDVSADKKFYEAAANNWLTLISALEKATKALEKYENTVLPSTNTDLRFFAKEALAEIAEMLGKD